MTAAAPPKILVDQIVPRPQLTGSEPCHTGTARFSHDSYRADQPETREAQRACRRCPFAAECLVWALANPELAPEGIWAATTPRERSVLRRRLTTRLGTGERYERALQKAYADAAATREKAAVR
ncbi:WhiB family transcriptional regulator [Streptomyces sp. NBC_00154]|uniref:WhiB family transcriptional regulator n=1 Tax=Streptomyces sp. NBC_00154 TaxID=2975670 RepID=UPI002259D25F|nr:WhiB family transcriptional regulator [Streptomyces sp. NBC_00154]MCX5318111.1 WhiB family transcriptional regulator [Streptomyces sp. NBC_00154]